MHQISWDWFLQRPLRWSQIQEGCQIVATITNPRRLSTCCDDHKSRKAVNLLRWSQIQEGCQLVAMDDHKSKKAVNLLRWSQIQEGCQPVAMITNPRRMPTCCDDHKFKKGANMYQRLYMTRQGKHATSYMRLLYENRYSDLTHFSKTYIIYLYNDIL